MTLPLLRVAELGDDNPVQFNFDVLAKLFIDTGNESIKIRFGTGSMTGNGTPTQTANVTHGMGSTPVACFAMAEASTLLPSTSTYGATTFQVALRHVDNTNWNTAQNFVWAAFG